MSIRPTSYSSACQRIYHSRSNRLFQPLQPCCRCTSDLYGVEHVVAALQRQGPVFVSRAAQCTLTMRGRPTCAAMYNPPPPPPRFHPPPPPAPYTQGYLQFRIVSTHPWLLPHNVCMISPAEHKDNRTRFRHMWPQAGCALHSHLPTAHNYHFCN